MLTFQADAFDWALINQTLSELRNQPKQGKPVEIPLYDFVTHSRHVLTDLLFLGSCFFWALFV